MAPRNPLTLAVRENKFMSDKRPKVLIGHETEIHVDWTEARAAADVSVELPSPPWAAILLNHGDNNWLLDQFSPANPQSDELVFGKGFDRLKARTETDGLDRQTLHLLDQRWEFSDLQAPEVRSSVLEAIEDIFRAHDFPVVREQPSRLEIAWAWDSEVLCWASVPSGARIEACYPGDPLSALAEATRLQTDRAAQKQACDTWTSVALSPRFYELFPPGSPIHWALSVQSLLGALDSIEAAPLDSASRGLVLESLRASFDAGAKVAEFEARRFSPDLEEWDRTAAIRQQQGARAAQTRKQEADERWYTVATDWLSANMPNLCDLGIEKIHEAIKAAEHEGSLKASIPDLHQFRAKFIEWENAGLFVQRNRKGKPGRPRRTG